MIRRLCQAQIQVELPDCRFLPRGWSQMELLTSQIIPFHIG